MGPAGGFGLVWLVLGALGPSPPAAGQERRCLPLNGTHCRCPPGYHGPPWERDGWEWPCEDINECVGEGPPPCPPSQSCNNTVGGFRCDCNRGYRRVYPETGPGTPRNGTGTPKNGTGTPQNGTGTPKNGTGTPQNGPGTPKNGPGTPRNGTGTPQNGPGTPKNGTGNPENGTGNPENGTGSPENGTGSPENGTGNPENGTGSPETGTEPPFYCEDVDECAEGGEGRCGRGLLCLNTPGSFECHCPPPARGPPDPRTGLCPAVPVPPEICGEEEGCDLGETLTRISEELRGGRDPRSVLQELLSVLDSALGGPGAAPPPPAHLAALLAAAERLGRAAGAGLGQGGGAGAVTNLTSARSALSLAVSRRPSPAPVTLAVPAVTLEVPPEVALDQESGLSLVALLTLGGLPAALQGGPPARWGGWGSLPRPPRRGRAFPRQRLLSPVATALVAREGPRGSPAVTLRFRHPAPDPKLGGRVLCAFWNAGEGLWDTGGCREVPPKNGDPPPGSPPGTVCACDHLTSFAVLLAFNEIQDHWLLDLVTQVALAVSLVALVAAAATFALCRALAEPRRTLQLHLSLSLLGGNLGFLLGIDGSHHPVTCTVTAVFLHLCYLSAFSWMALQGLHLYVLLVQVFAPAWLRPRLLLALGYGPPALIVALAAAAFPQGYGTDQYCWLSLRRGFRWSFQGPVIVITAANAVVLVVTLWKLVQKFNEVNADMGHLRRVRVLLVTSLGQLSLLGSGWALGVGAGLGWAGGAGPPLPPGSPPPPLPLLFCALNAAQGLLIFLCHCLGHPKVRGWYRSLLCPRARPYSEFTSNTSNTSNTSTGRVRGSQSHQ